MDTQVSYLKGSLLPGVGCAVLFECLAVDRRWLLDGGVTSGGDLWLWLSWASHETNAAAATFEKA
jgi:hypothetical protein